MQKSTIQFSITKVIIVLFFASCSSVNVVKDYESVSIEKQLFQNTYFNNSDIDYVYKANISVYGNNLTGIFIAKKINRTTHRVVFTTEFGNKLFDIEISETEFRINSIVDELNKKILINTLKNDFRLLFKTDFLVSEQYQNKTYKVIKSTDNNNFNYLFFTTSNNKLDKIIHTTKTKEKISISFSSENNIFAQNIIVQHYNIPMQIEFNYLKQNQ
ncbi:MAG: hypothetical protein IPN80_11815 [Flavobacterium sp.]|nr:hypothetical protein [Flavobacterium sp.]